jgi:HlyD family secretion protein
VVQNVVTYPVIVSAPNDALKLMPGMTANLAFEVDSREDCLRIPNAALRFYPDRALVHPDDHPILDGVVKDDSADGEAEIAPPDAVASANAQANVRHVWFVENNLLRAIEGRTGISDYKFTEIVAGELQPGKALVTGLEPKKS